MRLPFFKSYVRFCELKKGAIRYFLRAQVRYNERQRRQGGTYVPLKKLICVRVCERKKRGDMTYSEFRYLWNVREVEKDNASRLRDITNVMTVTKVSVFRALERLEKGGYVQKSKDRKALSNTEVCFSQYDDVMIRRLVGLIRVMKDRSIVIFLKGGLSVTEIVE